MSKLFIKQLTKITNQNSQSELLLMISSESRIYTIH